MCNKCSCFTLFSHSGILEWLRVCILIWLTIMIMITLYWYYHNDGHFPSLIECVIFSFVLMHIHWKLVKIIIIVFYYISLSHLLFSPYSIVILKCLCESIQLKTFPQIFYNDYHQSIYTTCDFEQRERRVKKTSIHLSSPQESIRFGSLWLVVLTNRKRECSTDQIAFDFYAFFKCIHLA